MTPIEMSSSRLRLTVWDHNKLWNNRFLGRAHIDLSGLRKLPHAEEKLPLQDMPVNGKVTETAGEGSSISFTVLSVTPVAAAAQENSEHDLPHVVLSPAEKTLYDAQALKWFQGLHQPLEQSRAHLQIAEMVQMLAGVPLFGDYDDEQLRKLALHFQPRHFRHGDHIIKQGDLGATFFILAKGTVRVKKDGEQVALLKEGAFFGEQALITAHPRNADVVAVGACVALEMGQHDFESFQVSRTVPHGNDAGRHSGDGDNLDIVPAANADIGTWQSPPFPFCVTTNPTDPASQDQPPLAYFPIPRGATSFCLHVCTSDPTAATAAVGRTQAWG